MVTQQDPDLDVDALMREIRAELAGKLGTPADEAQHGAFAGQAAPSPRGEDDGRPVTLGRLRETEALLGRKRQYALHELLAFHDEDFIRNAYLALLGREPDVEGASRYLAGLRSGSLANVEVLGRIRYSPEGRAARVRVAGLPIPFGLRTLRRVPVIGHVVGVVQYLLRLPTIVRNLERLETVVFHHRLEIRRGVNALETEIENAFHVTQRRFAARADAVDARLSRAHEATTSSVRDLGTRVDVAREALAARLDGRLERVERDKADASALDQLGTRYEALRQASDELAGSHRDLRGITDRIQASILALEQGKADQASTEAAIGRAANEILELRERIAAFEHAIAGQQTAAALIEGIATAEAARTEVRRLDTRLGWLREQVIGCQQEVIDQQRRLSILLDEVSKRLPAPLAPDQLETMVAEQDRLFDSFYVAFEDRFRGSREDIMDRVAVYLPYVFKAKAGTANAPVLDVGSGRGEWLEVLARSDLVARGVDSNRVVASYCRDRGLSVTEADAIEYLRGLETGSIGAITAMHVIEHLPFRRMLALFDEARRVLRPGGIAIFETPNPENLVVGACNFYYDPTHVRPLPPEPLRFVLAHRGFADVEILPLHPRHDAPAHEGALNPLDSEVTRRLFGEQDYAVIGYRK